MIVVHPCRSSDKELEHVWPVITEDDERDLDSLPPLRFNIVQLPASQSISAAAGNVSDRTAPSGDSVDTIVEDDMVDEVASGIEDIEIIDGDDDGDHDNDGDKKKKKKKEPTKKRTTLQDDIRSFIDTVKGTVQDNEEIHKAFHKILAHIHHKPDHKNSDEGETGQEDDGGIIALAILAEETGKMDAVTAGIVSALLAPAFMGPPPHPPHPPFFPPHHGRRGHHHGGPLPPPPPPPHFGRGKDGMPPPPPPPPHGFPPHHAPERGPSGRPPFPPPPPHFFSGRDADFFGMNGFEDPRFGMFKHGHLGHHYHGKGRGCPYGMPPFAGAPHMMRDGPIFGGRGGFPFGAAHHAPGSIFGGLGGYGKHEAAFEGPPFAFGGPHRHQHHHRGRHARFFDGHSAGRPHGGHHMRGHWQESDNDLPEHFGGMQMDEIDSNSDETTGASSSEEEDFPAFKKGRHGRFDGHSGAGQRGPPRPPHDRPRGPSEARKHHGEGPRGPLPYGKHGGPKHSDMPSPPPPPPHGPPRHHYSGRHHHGRWA